MATVTKRKWKRPDGSIGEKWMVRYHDPATGARPGKSFDLKKDADAFRRKVEREIEEGLHVSDRTSRTVKEIAESYLRHCEQREQDGRIGRGHLERQTIIIRGRIIPSLGHILMRDLTHEDVERWYGEMISGQLAPPLRPKHKVLAVRVQKPKLKPSTAKFYVYVLKYIERFATRRGYIKTQPVVAALAELRGVACEKVRTFTPVQVAGLLNAAEERRPFRCERDQSLLSCMVTMAALCGLRQGEILGLTLANVNLDRRVLHVRHNLTRHDELKGPKTNAGIRDVPVPERVARHLRTWLDNHYVANARELVFRTKPGNQITNLSLHRPWSRLLEYCGLKDGGEGFHFHALRHFHASWLVHNGVPITDVSAMLGHSHFDMTLQVYAHPVMTQQHRLDAIDRVTALLPAA